jgi:hypothetical protein
LTLFSKHEAHNWTIRVRVPTETLALYKINKEALLDVNILKYPSDEDWLLIKNLALGTVGKTSDQSPDTEWKRKILISEHSPIRSLWYTWEWVDLKSWVSVHFVRHNVGIQHFVKSQRNDRQSEYDRNAARQDALVTHRCTANAQAIINISRKRLCGKASPETTDAWLAFVCRLIRFAPELVSVCVPECVYRHGLCPEVFGSCGYNKTQDFEEEMGNYGIRFSK